MSDLVWTNCRVKLGDLKPWSDNPRYSTKIQAERLIKSFDKFGQVQTVAIDPDNVVCDGHQRLSALLTIHGADYELDARRSNRALTDDERRELVVVLHAGAVGAWNWDSICNWDVAALKGAGMDADLLKGLQTDAHALYAMLEAEKPVGDAEPEIDRAAELLEKWQVKRGDLFAIANHRLLCGDSTSREDVERVMGGEKAQLFFTDPPYGMDKGFANDELKDEDLTAFNDRWVAQFMGEDDCIFISFHSPRLFWTILDSARNNGWKVGRYFSLYKPNDMSFPWHSWLGVSESIVLFMRGKPKFNSDKPADTSFWHDTYLWNHKGMVAGETKPDGQALFHPSIKPIPVCEDLIWKTSLRLLPEVRITNSFPSFFGRTCVTPLTPLTKAFLAFSLSK